MRFRPSSFIVSGTRSWTSAFSILTVLSLVAIAAFMWSSRSQSAQTAPTRIGVIDVQKVVGQSVAGKASVVKLKTFQDERLARAKQMTEELGRLDAELKKPALTAARRNTLTQQVAEKRVALQRFAEDADKEFARTRDRELQTLEARVKPIIDAIGKEMGMAAIFNKFESGLMYASDSIDITNTVITRFNAAAPAPAAPPRD